MRFRFVAYAGIFGVLAAISPAIGATVGPAYTVQERAIAIASPSLALVEVRFEGFIRDRATGALVDEGLVAFQARCSGFVVSTAGYLVSASRCVQPAGDLQRGRAVAALANRLVQAKKLEAGNADSFINAHLGRSDFTGATADAAPTAKILVQLSAAAAGLTSPPAIAAKVVFTESVTLGDLAIVKVDRTGLPAVELTSGVLAADSQLIGLGFGTKGANPETATYAIYDRAAKIAGMPTPRSSLYEMDGDLGPSSHGGMVIDLNGRAAGMITSDHNSKEKSNRFIAESGHIKEFLKKAGAANEMAAMDVIYRAALDAYFKGNYTESVKKFDEIVGAQPGHHVAAEYRRQANERLAIEGDQGTATPAWALVTVSGLSGALFVVAVVLFLNWRSRRSRAVERMP